MVTESNTINQINFVVHEWAGYPLERIKQIKHHLPSFPCGLKNQIDSLIDYNTKFKSMRKVSYNLSITDLNIDYLQNINKEGVNIEMFKIYSKNNLGMDIGGYSNVIKQLVNTKDNELFFLINTSVSGNYGEKLEEYIKAFERYPNLGLLGISYSTKVYQTLIRNNFTPHVQSFFLVARSSALAKLLSTNNNEFPGEFEINKLALIRFGEARITSKIQKLGYDVGVVEPDGKLHFIPKRVFFNNGYNSWKLPHGDRRLSNGAPNFVHQLNLNH